MKYDRMSAIRKAKRPKEIINKNRIRFNQIRKIAKGSKYVDILIKLLLKTAKGRELIASKMVNPARCGGRNV